MHRRHFIATSLAALSVLALTACGTTEPAATDSASPTAASVTVTDGRGKKVTLAGPARKVVATEWNSVETLVSLGVMPVGAADVKGYGNYDHSAPLTGAVKDIGGRGEPSTDTIAALAPDLIVASSDLSASAVAQFEKVAPVIVVTAADGSRQYEQMVDDVNLIAAATGTAAKAKQNIAALETAIADGKAKLDAAGLAGTKLAFADGYQQGDSVVIRPYTASSLIGTVSTRLGLESPWTVKGDAAYGVGQTDVEGLTSLGDVQFTYFSNDADGADPFAKGLAGNAVWKSLTFVKNGNVHRLPDGIWPFGTTASMTAYAKAITEALTA